MTAFLIWLHQGSLFLARLPRPKLSHPVCLQPLCAHRWSLMWPDIVSRDRKLRSARVLWFGLASLGRLTMPVAKEAIKSILTRWSARVDGPRGVYFVLVWRMFNASFNIETWPLPAYGSRIYMPATRSVGLKLNGERERTWLAMPSIPYVDPVCKSVM